MIVLDSSAVLAFLFEENGGSKIADLLEGALISSVNVTEIIATQIDKGVPPSTAEVRQSSLNLDIRSFDEDLALLAGFLRSATRHKGLSLGDRACLALAIREKAVAVTADRKWSGLDLGCKIELIR